VEVTVKDRDKRVLLMEQEEVEMHIHREEAMVKVLCKTSGQD